MSDCHICQEDADNYCEPCSLAYCDEHEHEHSECTEAGKLSALLSASQAEAKRLADLVTLQEQAIAGRDAQNADLARMLEERDAALRGARAALEVATTHLPEDRQEVLKAIEAIDALGIGVDQ